MGEQFKNNKHKNIDNILKEIEILMKKTKVIQKKNNIRLIYLEIYIPRDDKLNMIEFHDISLIFYEMIKNKKKTKSIKRKIFKYL